MTRFRRRGRFRLGFERRQFVKRENLDRNHYSEGQRAMVGAKLKSLFEEHAKQRQIEAGGDKKSYEASVTKELRSVPVNLPEPPDKGDSRDKAAVAPLSGGRAATLFGIAVQPGSSRCPACAGSLQPNRRPALADTRTTLR